MAKKKYTPAPPIPERGNVLNIPLDFLVNMNFMSEEQRLEMFTSMMKWMLELDDEIPMLIGIHRMLFEQWQGAQMRFVQSARKTQAQQTAKAMKRWHPEEESKVAFIPANIPHAPEPPPVR